MEIPENWGATGVKVLVCTDFHVVTLMARGWRLLKTCYALFLAGDLKMKSGDEKIVCNIDKIGEGRDWLSEWHLMKEVTTFCEGKAAV